MPSVPPLPESPSERRVNRLVTRASNAISGVVAMPIDNRFETVEIENHHASARSIEKRAEMGFEATAVFQPGQRIGRRQLNRGFDIVAVGISLPPDLRAHASGKFVAIDRAQSIVVHAKIEAAQDLPAILGVGDRQHRSGSEPRAKPEPVVREIETGTQVSALPRLRSSSI
jgi:hypothetical protein